MITRIKKMNYFALLGLLISLLSFTGSVSAKACKGMSKSACTSATSCSWVKAYKTKKNVKVDAYCRNKAKKSAKGKKKIGKPTTKKAAAKEKEAKKDSKKIAKSSKDEKKASKKKAKKSTKKKKKSKSKKEKK